MRSLELLWRFLVSGSVETARCQEALLESINSLQGNPSKG